MKYRKKPVIIEAFRLGVDPELDWFWPAQEAGDAPGDYAIRTLEGRMMAHPGNWIIRGVKGEVYPCRDDIFQATYEPADAQPVHVDAHRTALQHLAPWAVALLDAGLVKAAGGWYHPDGVVAIWAANGRWWTSAVVVLETEPYPTEEEAARAWLAARGAWLAARGSDAR